MNTIVCLDLEGVLVPEIWIAFAEKTKIKELRLTTRDISDYDELMQYRLKILKEKNLKLKDIQAVIDTMDPLEGALDFLNQLREMTQVLILSDTFLEFAKPLMRKLAWPTLFCNSLVIDDDNMIADYTLRQQDGKRKAVTALQGCGFHILAAGDSFNDVTMLQKADQGFFFRAPDSIREQYPNIPAAENHQQLLEMLKKNL